MTAPGLAAYLATRDDRCACGYHVPTQGCHCAGSEWTTFRRALVRAADDTGAISQTRVRPLIQGIPHKHRGALYRRAVAAGLIAHDGHEPSTDTKGKNTDKQQRRYRLLTNDWKAAA